MARLLGFGGRYMLIFANIGILFQWLEEEHDDDKTEEEGKFIKPGGLPSISHIEGWTNV